MNRKTAVIAALCAFALCAGCAGKITEPDAPTGESIESVSAQDVSESASAVVTTAPEESTSAETTAKEPETELIIRPTEEVTYSKEGIPVANAYFNLKLPAEWDGHYLSATNYEGDVMLMRFRERTSAEAGADGTLFTLALAPDGSSYKAENGKELYQIADGNDRYTLYVLYPKEAGYAPEAKQQYEAMKQQVSAVLKTLEPGEGFRFQ